MGEGREGGRYREEERESPPRPQTKIPNSLAHPYPCSLPPRERRRRRTERGRGRRRREKKRGKGGRGGIGRRKGSHHQDQMKIPSSLAYPLPLFSPFSLKRPGTGSYSHFLDHNRPTQTPNVKRC